LFAKWQPRYAEHGIATFPVEVAHCKRPAIRGYLKVGSDLSSKLAAQFGESDAFGFALGPRSRITVLDIDTPEEPVLWRALEKHGSSPLLVRSGSGNWQAWYRHGGEGRHIRPWGSELPIDVLGAGFVVAPPSMGVRGQYEIMQGSLDDLEQLPPLRSVDIPSRLASCKNAPEKAAAAAEGTRNDTLWRACMRHAPRCESLDDVFDFARTRNKEQMLPPLAEIEVARIARSAWDYTERGANWFAVCGGAVALPNSTVDGLAAGNPHAFALLAILRRTHGMREQFVLAKETAEKLGWTLRRFRAARRRLEIAGVIRCVRPGGRGPHDPPVYTWPQGV
jgi:hypothetical protein